MGQAQLSDFADLLGNHSLLEVQRAVHSEDEKRQIEADQDTCTEDLSKFIRKAWGVVDPARYVHGWHVDAMCFPYDQEVLTEAGPKPIGWVVENRWHGKVLSFNHQTEMLEWRAVIGHCATPNKQTVDLHLTTGGSVTMTAEHPVFVQGQEPSYRPVSSLTGGEHLLRLRDVWGAVLPADAERKRTQDTDLLTALLSGPESEPCDQAAYARLRTLRQAVSSCLDWPAVLRHALFWRSQDHPGELPLSPVRGMERLGRQDVQGVLESRAIKPERRPSRLLQTMRGGDISQQRPVGGIAANSWRILQSYLSLAVYPWSEQFSVCGWSPASGLSGEVSGFEVTGFESRKASLLSLLKRRAARRASHRPKRKEQRTLELGGAMPSVSQLSARCWEDERPPSGSAAFVECHVRSVEPSLRPPETVYNVEVEGNHNYFVGGVLAHNCDHLMAVADGQIRKLLINLPPRCMKSKTVSEFFPAWIWANQRKEGFPLLGPQVRFLCLSYSSTLALDAARNHRKLVGSPWFQNRWGGRCVIDPDNDRADNFMTTVGGQRITTGFGGGVLGRGGDIRIIDDPHKPDEVESELVRNSVIQQYDEELALRVTDPRSSAEIIIMQRLAENDLSGHILEQGGDDLVHLCYDDQTEVLSRGGWVKFKDLPRDTEVMGVRPSDLRGTWEVPTGRVEYAYKGGLHHYVSTQIDLAVTPDHRMVFKDFNDWNKSAGRPHEGRRHNWRVGAARDLPNHFYVPQAIEWSGDGGLVNYGGLTWAPDAFAEFMGWYLAEGCADRYRTRICQNEGPKADEIRLMLSTTPVAAAYKTYKAGVRGLQFSVGNKTLARALAALGNSHTKLMPPEVKNLPPSALRKMIVAYMKGDGSRAGRNGHGFLGASRSKRLIDDMQECAAKAGWATSSRAVEVRPRPFNGHIMPGGTMHHLYLRSHRSQGEDRKWYARVGADVGNVKRLEYDGIVYCVSVPSGALLVRRNGKASVSGNCLPMEYDPERHCVTVLGWEDPRGCDNEGDKLPETNDDGHVVPGSLLDKQTGDLLWPERFTRVEVDKLKPRLGPYGFAGRLQQAPTPRGGGVLKADWWRLWKAKDYPDFSTILVSLDTASTEKEENDESALTAWGAWADDAGHPQIMLIDAWEGFLEFDPLIQRTVKMCRAANGNPNLKADILLVEAKNIGHPVMTEVRRLMARREWQVLPFNPQGDKISRAIAIQHMFSGTYREDIDTGVKSWTGGTIWAPDTDWAQMVIDRCASFPKGKRKGIVDTVTQAIKFLRDAGIMLRTEESDDEKEEERRYKKPRKPAYDV